MNFLILSVSTSSADKNVRTFSFGMKQRLALAQSLLTNPDLLILDEPFVGLDPVGIEDTKHLLLTLCREQNTSIIFSSHQLNEVCDLADDIIILSEGCIKVSDTYRESGELRGFIHRSVKVDRLSSGKHAASFCVNNQRIKRKKDT